MALREFSDRTGRVWRVWDVTAEKLHPSTRAEDYLRDYLGGWLAFESADGQAKCRLTPIPRDWENAPIERLELWLRAAEAVRGDRELAAVEERAEHDELADVGAGPADTAIATPRPRTRTFRFPGGRYWTVAEWFSPDPRGGGGTRRVLRFASGSRSLEIDHWPHDWMLLGDEELAELLARSFPREVTSEATPDQPTRRASDPRP